MEEPTSRPVAPTPAFTALRVFGWVVMALMIASVAYAAWLSISNWHAISV